MDYEKMDSLQIDVLREIGNIGSGNAATSLSEFLSCPVNIGVPSVQILDYDQVVEALGGPETMMVGLLLQLEDDFLCMIMFLLHKEFAHMALSALMGDMYNSFDEMDEISASAMQEVGNIMAASYVNAIADMTGLSINISVPSICMDMAGAIVSVPAVYYADISDKIIFIGDDFVRDDSHHAANFNSHILMIPESDSREKIMTSLGIEI